MRVEAVTSIGRNPNLRQVKGVDGEAVVMHLETIIGESIQPGREFETSRWEAILASDAKIRCRAAAWGILAESQKDSHTLKKALIRKGFTQEIISAVLLHLADGGYVNDSAWAEQFARERFLRGEGARLIASRLQRRGFDRQIIDKALENARPDDGELLQSAQAELEKWNRRSKPEDPRKRAHAAGQFLLRRGYDSSLAWRVVRNYFRECGEE